MRIVSLNCSNTEIVCALGCADYLVGVDDHSDYPVDVVSALPRVGPDLGIDIDRVVALQPDLVLASLTVPGHEKVIAGLEAAGLTFLAPEPLYLADVSRDIRDIGRALGVTDRAQRLVNDFEAEIGPEAARNDGPSILVQWWPKPVIAPGAQSWVNGLLDAAGAHNPLREEPIKSRPISDDEVIQINPDAVVISWCGVKTEKYRPDVIYRNPAWQELNFVSRRRVYCVPEAWLGRPSQRLAEGCNALRNIVAELASSD